MAKKSGKSGKSGKSSKPAPEVRVYVVAPKGGKARARVHDGNKPGGSIFLSEFSKEVQDLLEGKPQGSFVVCQADEAPAEMRPKPGAVVVVPEVKSDDADVGTLSDLDRHNPFNFVEWDGRWAASAEDPAEATHERWREARTSGVIEVTLEARAPIFVPAGGEQAPGAGADRAAVPFWSCVHPDGERRYGIPGSSVKGALRTVFEAWTNSRLGIVSPENYQDPIPYRRRTADAWVVKAVNPDGSRTVMRCQAEFLLKDLVTNAWSHRVQHGAQATMEPWDETPVEHSGTIIDPTLPGWQALPYRANLFWVPDHRHQYNFLGVRVGTQTATISAELVERYRRSLKHLAFREHWKRVKDLPRAGTPGGGSKSYYQAIDQTIVAPMNNRQVESLVRSGYDAAYPGLDELDVGTVLFAMVDDPSNRVLCFGKNVNFLWPARKSPEQLAGKFWPSVIRRGDLLTLAGADPAEAVFGFAAPHRRDEAGAITSHPFRGRLRCTTFWAAADAEPLAPVALLPLLSPSGVKLKARPIYLPPTGADETQTYDEALRLRGRKFYWHQGECLEELPEQHRGDPAEGTHPLVAPLPARTRFTGQIHFDNLTRIELGALLVALCPDLYFGEDGRHGWKLGKAKGRGLGSVHVGREGLRLLKRSSAASAWAGLSGQGRLSLVSPDSFVSAFRVVAPETAGRVRDLRKLLRFPAGALPPDRRKKYLPPNNPSPYGWMPAFDDAMGEPKGGTRPSAMRRAREL